MKWVGVQVIGERLEQCLVICNEARCLIIASKELRIILP